MDIYNTIYYPFYGYSGNVGIMYSREKDNKYSFKIDRYSTAK